MCGSKFVHADDFASGMILLWLLVDCGVGSLSGNRGPEIFTTSHNNELMSIAAYCVFMVVERIVDLKIAAIAFRQALFKAFRRRCTEVVLGHAATRERACRCCAAQEAVDELVGGADVEVHFSGLDEEIALVVKHLESHQYEFYDFLFTVAVLGAVAAFGMFMYQFKKFDF